MKPLASQLLDIAGLRHWLIAKNGRTFQGPYEAYTLAALGAFAESVACLETLFESERVRGVVPYFINEYCAFRDLLEHNPSAVGDALRDNERRLIAQAKFDALWQPSPFPFELANKT